MAGRKPPQGIMNMLARASQEHGVPFNMLRSFADIESGFRPGARTGSYKGLFQLSTQEFRRGGGRGSIFNPEANTNAFVNVLKKNIQAFERVMGRKPNGWEAYLVHQQGVAGGPAHLRNPDKPAWQNMANTPEGRKKGARWAKKAIWGNVPAKMKKQFGSVENINSGQFAKLWQARYERAGGSSTEQGFDTAAANTPDLPTRGMRVAEIAGVKEQGRLPQEGLADGVNQNVVMVGGGEEPPPVPQRRPVKFDYRAEEYASSNDIGAGGPPIPTKNPQDAPAPPQSAILPGSADASRSGNSRMATPATSGSDNWQGRAFGGSFGELYARPDMGSSLLRDVLPTGKPAMSGGGVPPPPPMFKQFFQGLFGGFG